MSDTKNAVVEVPRALALAAMRFGQKFAELRALCTVNAAYMNELMAKHGTQERAAPEYIRSGAYAAAERAMLEERLAREELLRCAEDYAKARPSDALIEKE